MQPDTLVTLCLERGFDMIIAILGVIKAGGAYVPIDPEYPENRIQFIIEDTQSSLLLTQSSLQDKIHQVLDSYPKKLCQPIWLDQKPYQEHSSANLSPMSQSTDLAYVIYTSGTTGSPKGVLQLHSNVHRLLSATANYYNFNSSKFLI